MTDETTTTEEQKKDILSGEEIRDLFKHGRSRYLLVNLVSRRCKQLIHGAPPLVPREGLSTPLDVVVAEMESAKLALREEDGTSLIDAIRIREDKVRRGELI